VTSQRGEKARKANFADRFGVSSSTLYRNAADPESPKMLMMECKQKDMVIILGCSLARGYSP